MYLALHECGHLSQWRDKNQAPKAGELITCFRCAEGTRIKEVYGPWRARCADCRRINHHADYRKTVMDHAIKHVQEWTTHRVKVWAFGNRSSVVLITRANVGEQPALFTDAPF